MDTARRMASELAAKLQCRAWVSLRSWHVPGATIRITLAPLHTVAPVVANSPTVNRTTSLPQNATVGQQWPHGASARVALCRKFRRTTDPPADGSSPGKPLF
jgi:hypothetical protein